MIVRRIDDTTRKRGSEASQEEVKIPSWVSEKTGLPNKRAFDEGARSVFIAMADLDGLKALNDTFGYTAGDTLLRRFAEVLAGMGLDAYHDKADEFLCKGNSYSGLNTKLTEAQAILRKQLFAVEALDGGVKTVPGAEFCFGIGTNLQEAERSLKHQKNCGRSSVRDSD